MLVLYGEWLKAVGFPIGSAAYFISDQQGEIALRVGPRVPRRLRGVCGAAVRLVRRPALTRAYGGGLSA